MHSVFRVLSFLHCSSTSGDADLSVAAAGEWRCDDLVDVKLRYNMTLKLILFTLKVYACPICYGYGTVSVVRNATGTVPYL